MRSKIVLGGRFRVFEDGSINRLADGAESPANICWTSRDRRYGSVSYYVKGKQRMAYVHRLVAEAFIPNPDKLKQVNHKDGNTHNNAVDNLEWVSPQGNVKHAFDAGLAIPGVSNEPCLICGDFTPQPSGLCRKCEKTIAQLRAARERRERQKERYSTADKMSASKKENAYLSAAAIGLTSKEIADIMGVSKQAVNQALHHAVQRTKKESAPAE